jgi:hypothetical protein
MFENISKRNKIVLDGIACVMGLLRDRFLRIKEAKLPCEMKALVIHFNSLKTKLYKNYQSFAVFFGFVPSLQKKIVELNLVVLIIPSIWV